MAKILKVTVNIWIEKCLTNDELLKQLLKVPRLKIMLVDKKCDKYIFVFFIY